MFLIIAPKEVSSFSISDKKHSQIISWKNTLNQVKISKFFSIWVFFHDHSQVTNSSLTLLLAHRHLDFSGVIAAES